MDPSDANARVSSSSLPEELIVELLLRLPVKSLVRFRCVCKEWKSLTTNPSFIYTHFRNGYASNSSITWNDENRLKLPSSMTGCSFRSGVYSFLPLDFKSLGFEKRPDCIVGQCDGIFCFYWDLDDHLALCNPAIREFRDIRWDHYISSCSDTEFDPDSISYSYSYSYSSASDSGSKFLFGFGFDPNTNDYKVVKLEADDSEPINCAEIYSMESGSWRRITGDDALQDVDLSCRKQGNSNYSDGVIYWSVYKYAEGQDSDDEGLDYDDEELDPDDEANVAILSFDLRDEVFHLTAFPTKYYAFESVSVTKEKKHNLSMLHGKLAILGSFFDGSDTSFDVWVMDKDEVQDPWSHILTVEPLSGFCRALCFWKHNDLVILRDCGRYDLTRGWPYLYDCEAKKVTELELSGDFDFIYRESLVSVKGCNG